VCPHPNRAFVRLILSEFGLDPVRRLLPDSVEPLEEELEFYAA
jgi:hypothetical protein